MNSVNRVVSSEAEELILVDAGDNEIGHLSKGLAHDGGGVLHRAFSVFLFNTDGELLLQQRNSSKRLWPGFWSNSCCSHPRRGETMAVATERRLQDELNLSADLEYVYRFQYQAQYDDSGSEHELCHVFLGRVTEPVQPNESEIDAVRFVSADALAQEFEQQPDAFTPWFKLEWQALTNDYTAALSRFTGAPGQGDGR